MQIITERLVIRKGRNDDCQKVLLFRNSEFVLKYNCMSVANEEDMTSELLHDDSFVMVLKDTDIVIGVIDIHEDSIRYRIASKELSYYLDEKYARCGYMKEALEALIDYLFQYQNLECISARAFTANVASTNLLKSLGFHQDGIIVKCVKAYQDIVYDDGIYSLLKENWRK